MKFCQNTLVMEIRVYYNLRKRCLSVQGKVDGEWRVARHAEQCIIKNAKFKVSEAGRIKTLSFKVVSMSLVYKVVQKLHLLSP